MHTPSRTAVLSGVAGIVLLDLGWFWDPTPPIDWPDRRLDAYLATHSTTSWLLASAAILLAVPFLWRFGGALRDRLAAGGAAPRVQRTACTAARFFACTVFAFGLLYASLPIGGVFDSDFGAPSAAIYRYVGGADFGLYIVSATLCVLAMIGAVVVAAFRDRAVPLGLGIAGIPLGLLVVGTFFLPMAGITLWFLASSITLAVSRPVGARPAVSQPGRVPAAL